MINLGIFTHASTSNFQMHAFLGTLDAFLKGPADPSCFGVLLMQILTYRL